MKKWIAIGCGGLLVLVCIVAAIGSDLSGGSTGFRSGIEQGLSDAEEITGQQSEATTKPTNTPRPAATATSERPTSTPRAAATATPVPAVITTRQPIQDVGAYPCQAGQIKGNRNSKIFHPPGYRDYEKTQENVQCFDTEAQAAGAGYRRAQR